MGRILDPVSSGSLSPIGVVASGYLRPVATRPNPYNAGVTGDATHTGATYRTAHIATANIESLVLMFGNWFGNAGASGNGAGIGAQADGPNAITVKCSVETLDGTIIRGYFPNGSRSITLDPGANVFTAPISVTIPKGTKFFLRTYVSVASAGQLWPVGLTANWSSKYGVDAVGDGTTAGNGEGGNYSEQTGDLTTSGTVPAHFLFVYSPFAILGATSDGVAATVAFRGDSIMASSFDAADTGFAWRALNKVYGYIQMAEAGETAALAINAANMDGRLRGLPFVTHAIVHDGVNDVTAGTAAATIETNLIAQWKALANRGVKPFACTISPNTTSTDGWTTLANQTVVNSAIRLAVNQWLRGGAPMVGGAAVALGTGGAITCAVYDQSGTLAQASSGAGHPLQGVFDTGGVNESSLDSGKWRVDGTRTTSADGAITSGTPTLTSATASFTTADVGKGVLVPGAGSAGGNLVAQIGGVTNSTTVTLTTTASTTVSASTLTIGAHTRDGVHPLGPDHANMAAAIPMSAFVVTA